MISYFASITISVLQQIAFRIDQEITGDDDPFTFLEARNYFGVAVVSASELHIPRLEQSLFAFDDDDLPIAAINYRGTRDYNLRF